MNPENKGTKNKSNKGTQTKQAYDENIDKSDGKKRKNLPLPRDISNSVRGPITTFEFCKVFQPANEPCGLTIVHEQITEEETEPKNSEIEKKRYRYCKEILKPYLKNYPPDCPDLTETFIKHSIESAEEETPDQQPCFSFEGFKISGLDPSALLQDSSEGSHTPKNKGPKNTKDHKEFNENKDNKGLKEIKCSKDNTSAKTELQSNKNSAKSKESTIGTGICKPFDDLSLDKAKSLNPVSSSESTDTSAKTELQSNKNSAKSKESTIGTGICKPFDDLSLDKAKSLNPVSSSESTDSIENKTPRKRIRKTCKRKVSKTSSDLPESSTTESNTKSAATMASNVQTFEEKMPTIETQSVINKARDKSDSNCVISDSSTTLKSKSYSNSSLPSQTKSKSTTRSDLDSKCASPNETDSKTTNPATSVSKSSDELNMVCMLDRKPSKKSDKIEAKPNDKSDSTQKTDTNPCDKYDKVNLSTRLDTNPTCKTKITTEIEDTSSTEKLEPTNSNISCNLSCNVTCTSDEELGKKLDKIESKMKQNEKSDSFQETLNKVSNKCDVPQASDNSNLSGNCSSNLHKNLSKTSDPCNKKESKSYSSQDTGETTFCDKSKSLSKDLNNLGNKSDSTRIDKMESKTNKKIFDPDTGISQCELSIFRIISTRVCALSDSGENQGTSKLTIENQNSENFDCQDQSDSTNKQQTDLDNSAQTADANNKNSDFGSKMPIASENDFCNILKNNSNKDELNVIKNVSNESVECEESKLSKCMRESKENRDKGQLCAPFEDLCIDKTKSINSVDDSKTSKSCCESSKNSSKAKSSKCGNKGECKKFCSPFENLNTSKTKMCNPGDGGKFCPPFSELSREKTKSINPIPKQDKKDCNPVTRRKIETYVCPEQKTVYTIITSMLCPSCDNNSTEKSLTLSCSKELKTPENPPVCPPKPPECPPKPPECPPKPPECPPKPPECPPKPPECPPKPRKCSPKSDKNIKPATGSSKLDKAKTENSAAPKTRDTEPGITSLLPTEKLEQLKQDMLEAHCKTMATIKVAAEDVLCTVAKKTKEICEDPNAVENVRKSAEDLFEEVRKKTNEICGEKPPECPPGTVYEQICEKTKELCRTTKNTVSEYFKHDEKCRPKPKTKAVSNLTPGKIRSFNLFSKFSEDEDEDSDETENETGESLNTLVDVVDMCSKELSERLSRFTLELGETSSIYDQPTPIEPTPKKMSLSEMDVDMPEVMPDSRGHGVFSSIKEKIFSIFRDKEADKISIPSDHTLSIEKNSKEDSDLDEADP